MRPDLRQALAQQQQGWRNASTNPFLANTPIITGSQVNVNYGGFAPPPPEPQPVADERSAVEWLRDEVSEICELAA